MYLDRPFNSARNYKVLFAEQNGLCVGAQIQAFKDTWRWDATAANAYRETVQAGDAEQHDVLDA